MAYFSLGQRKSFVQKKTNQTAHTEAVSGEVGSWSRTSTSKTIYIELTDSDGVTETPTLSNLSFTNTPTGFSYTLGTCSKTTAGVWRQRVNLKKSNNSIAFLVSYTATWNYVKGTTTTNTFYYVEDQYSYGYLNEECFVPGDEKMIQKFDLEEYIEIENYSFTYDEQDGDGARIQLKIKDTYKGPPIQFFFNCSFTGDSSTSGRRVFRQGSGEEASQDVFTYESVDYTSCEMNLRGYADGYKVFNWDYDE